MTLLTNKISIGSDHAGFDSKKSIKDYLLTLEIDFFDFGCFSEDCQDNIIMQMYFVYLVGF